MLDGKAVRGGCVECGAFGGGEAGRKNGGFTGSRSAGADAILQMDRVVLQVMNAVAGALVGVSHRAAVFQAPFARGSDGAVNAARTTGGAGDDAWAGRIERRRNLNHHGDVLVAAAVVRVGDVFSAGNPAFTGRHHPPGIDVGTVQAAVATGCADVEQSAVVVENCDSPQFGGRRVQGIHSGRSRPAQAGFPQTRRQQVVGRAVVTERSHHAQGRGFGVCIFGRAAATAAGAECEHRCGQRSQLQSESFRESHFPSPCRLNKSQFIVLGETTYGYLIRCVFCSSL